MLVKTFVLAHQQARDRASSYILNEAPDGYVVRVTEPAKRREQEEKYHAMIGEIAAQTMYAGQRWDADDMKRILVDEFAEEMRAAGSPLHRDSRLIPSKDGRRVIQLGIQTRNFSVREASDFIEFLSAWCVSCGMLPGNFG